MEQSSFERVTNSKFYALGEKLGDIMVLSLCWFICCIPVITIGPSSAALYYAVHKRFEDKSSTPAKDFFRSFRKNLGQGIVLTLILLIYLGITGFNLYVAILGFNGVFLPSWYSPIAVSLLLPFIFSAMYIFPYLSRFKNTIKTTLFHGFTFSTMYPGHTLMMWLYVIITVALMIFFFPSILFAPFTCCYLCRRYCERDFNYALLLRDKREHPEKYQDEENNTEEDEDLDEDLYEEYDISDDDEDEEDDEDDEDIDDDEVIDEDDDNDLEEDVKDAEVCQVDDDSPSE